MRIGIIAEGRPDQAVLHNIVDSYFKGHEYDVVLLRPDLALDATDRKLRDSAAAGGLSRIKKDCEERTLFEEFFILDYKEEDKIIIQADTAEIDEYNVIRPNKKEDDYTIILRNNIIQKIKEEWLENNYSAELLFAISIEELEAWILILYENRNSTLSINPKSRLQRILSKQNINSKEEYDNYLDISKGFKKAKILKKCLKHNDSLKLFCDDLEALVNNFNTNNH